MKRIVYILVALVLGVPALAQDLTIIHLNDTHSHIDPIRTGAKKGLGGVIEQAAYIDSVRNEDGNKNVLLLHAGDFGQGTSYFTELNGNMEIDVLNAFKCDAVCLGNHEFDNGIDELARRLGNLKCPVVCANYSFKDTPLEKYVEPFVIVKKAGLKIGIIGLLTDVTKVVDSSVASGLKYLNPSIVANRYAEFLKFERGCDIVICLTHIGYDEESGPDNDLSLAAKSRNIDLIVGGHSHTFLKDQTVIRNLNGERVKVVTDGCWGLQIGNLKVRF